MEIEEKRIPIDIVLHKETEPLYPSGFKYVAYTVDNIPLYMAGETTEAAEARVRREMPIKSISVGK